MVDYESQAAELMQFFSFSHLPPDLKEVSRPFGELALRVYKELPSNQEMLMTLRKLLEAKDCAVRAKIFKEVPRYDRDTLHG